MLGQPGPLGCAARFAGVCGVHGALARCEAMSDFAHAPLTKALDIAVLIAHAFWRNSGPAGSMPNYTCGPATPLRCAMACCDAAGLLG
jgi:hypothetical protein